MDSKYLDRDWYNARAQFERDYLEAQIKAAGGSLKATARRIGMERGSLYRKLDKLGIKPRRVLAEIGIDFHEHPRRNPTRLPRHTQGRWKKFLSVPDERASR